MLKQSTFDVVVLKIEKVPTKSCIEKYPVEGIQLQYAGKVLQKS